MTEREAADVATAPERLRSLLALPSAPVFGLKVTLLDPGWRIIDVIKEIRAFAGVGLKEAKDKAESTPSMLATVASVAEARSLLHRFRSLGAVAQAREPGAPLPLPLARLVAQNPSTPADLLERLAWTADAGVRRSVATNPSTPRAELFALFYEIPEAFARNPLVPLLMLEDPSLRWVPWLIAERLAEDPACFGLLLPGLLSTSRGKRLLARRSLRGYDAGLVRALLQDPDEDVRAELVSNPELAPELVAELARDPSETVFFYLLERDDLPELLLRELRVSTSDDERREWIDRALAQHRHPGQTQG